MKIQEKQKILLVICSFLFYARVLATEYYIAPDGNDSNPGSMTLPWKTITKANTTLRAGDTVFLRQGTYPEDINPVNSGNVSSPIKYRSYNGETATIMGLSSRPEVAVVGIGYPGSATGWGSKSNIIIDGITIDPSSARYGVVIYGHDAFNNQIRNCKLINQIGGKRDGILIGSAQHTLIENNIIDGTWRLGIITTQTPKYTIVRGNTIQNMQNSGIDIQTSYGVNQAFLIENNIISGSIHEDGIQFEPDYSRFDVGTMRGVIIRNNKLFNNVENAIDLKGAADVVIDGNIIWGNRGDNDGSGNLEGGTGGIMKGDITNCQAHDILIRRNIIYDNLGGICISNYGWVVVNNTIIGNNRTFWGPDVSEQEIINTSIADARRAPGLFGIMLTESRAPNLHDCIIKNNIIGNHHQCEIALWPNGDLEGSDIDNNLYFNKDTVRMVDFTAPWNWKKIDFNGYKMKIANVIGLVGKEESSLIELNPTMLISNMNPIGDGPFDFNIESHSQAIDHGGYLTQAVNTGSGTILHVKNSRVFSDGYGIVGGDTIKISNGQIAQIVSIDNSTHTLTLDHEVNWKKGDGISLLYNGSAPDIGAFEFSDSFNYMKYGTNVITLFADISVKYLLINNIKTLQVKLQTSGDIISVPNPLILEESDNTKSSINLNGNVPGSHFTGILTIDNDISEGPAIFYLPENSLVSNKNVSSNEIRYGKTVNIDKTLPSLPRNLTVDETDR